MVKGLVVNLDQGRDGVNAAVILKDGAGQVGDRGPDSPVGVAFELQGSYDMRREGREMHLDDFVSSVDYLLVDRLTLVHLVRLLER